MTMKMKLAWGAAACGLSLSLSAATLTVQNASFEAPSVPNTVPALPFFEAWQHTPKPDWYIEDPATPESQWANLAGVFPNPAAGQPGNIANIAGSQAAYLFAVPSNGIYQELDARFEIAKSYQLTVALVASASIQPTEGSTLAISLYYRDANNQIVSVATTNVTYNPGNFPNLTNFIDFNISTERATRANDPWTGRKIGVLLASTAAPDKAGGIWDIDNIRLTALSVPNGSFEAPEVPTTVPALPFLAAWQHTPKPDWYVEDPNAPEAAWANLAGVFPNPASDSPGNISNLEGKQAAYVFAVPSNGIYQETTAVYEPNVFYQLTAGFVGSASIPPPAGTTLTMELYYTLGDGSRIPLVSKEVVYNSTNFTSLTNLVDFTATTQPLTNGHPALGKNIGVSFTTTVAPAGGIWDIDNVSLSGSLLQLAIARTDNNLRLSWPAGAGINYQLQKSEDLVAWVDSGPVLPGNGSEITVEQPAASGAIHSFYRLRISPL